MTPAPAIDPRALAAALGARPIGFTARAPSGLRTGFAAMAPRSGHTPARDADLACPSTLDPQTFEDAGDPDLPQTRYNARDLECARADAFAAGLETGRAHGEAAVGASLDDALRLTAALAATRAIDTDALATALAEAACSILAELLDTVPDLAALGIEQRARGALAALGETHEPATLWLAPADAAVLAPRLGQAGPSAIAIVPDPTLARGALRLTTRHSRIDDSPMSRLERLAAPMADAALLAARAA